MYNHHPKFDPEKIKSIPDVLDFCISQYAEETAFTTKDAKGSINTKSFQALRDESLAVAAELDEIGCGKKRAAIISENSVEWIEAFFAISCAGGVGVPLDRELSANDLAKLIKRSDCSAVFYSKSYESKADELKKEFENIHFICLDEFESIARKHKGAAFKPVQPEDDNQPAIIVFTSGTMGESKGVVLSHKNVISNTLSGCEIIGDCEKAVLILPLHHTFGLITGIIGPLLLHGNVFISKSIRRVQKDMEFFGPDIILVVPIIAETIYKKIMAEIEKQGKTRTVQKGIKLSNTLRKIGIDKRDKLFHEILAKFGGELKSIICGGAPINENIVRGLCDLGIETRNGYGITECSPIVSVNLIGKGKNKIGSAGPAMSCCKIRIKNPDKDGIGEIEVCGSNVMLGYLDDEQATKEAFDGEWFRTGDLGFLDGDGYLYLTGRKKNLIILSNGKNVSPEEIESKLLENDLIKEVVVFEENAKICAEIYPGEDYDYDNEKPVFDMVDAFNRTVPPYKNIEKIIIRKTEFPKTTTMKIKRGKMHANV
ncbi:MAG: AMP-binding protein [Acutalibacteraceae bacterium]